MNIMASAPVKILTTIVTILRAEPRRALTLRQAVMMNDFLTAFTCASQGQWLSRLLGRRLHSLHPYVNEIGGATGRGTTASYMITEM